MEITTHQHRQSILETKGLFWGWFIHFLPDVVVFASYAIAWFQK